MESFDRSARGLRTFGDIYFGVSGVCGVIVFIWAIMQMSAPESTRPALVDYWGPYFVGGAISVFLSGFLIRMLVNAGADYVEGMRYSAQLLRQMSQPNAQQDPTVLLRHARTSSRARSSQPAEPKAGPAAQPLERGAAAMDLEIAKIRAQFARDRITEAEMTQQIAAVRSQFGAE